MNRATTFFSRAAFLAGIAILLFTAETFAEHHAETSTAERPVDDTAIRARFDKELTDLMESGQTTEIDVLLTGLQNKKVSAEHHFAHPRPNQADVDKAALFERARKASLILGRVFQCGKCDRWHGNHSGAVLIDPSGIAVTNYHVMDQKDSGAFGAMDTDGQVYPVVEILAACEPDDVAIVRLGRGERQDAFPFVPLSTGDPTGASIRVISHPGGNFYTVSEGIIARYFLNQKNSAERLQITADFARGSSGSGVFNDKGELTGIVIATHSLYYDEHDGVQRNLQMVVKSCAPVTGVRALFE